MIGNCGSCQKIPPVVKCKVCGRLFRRNWAKQECCSRVCGAEYKKHLYTDKMIKLNLTMSLERIDPKTFYSLQQWKELRYVAFLRYGRICALCGATDKALHVDHIKPKSLFPKLALDIDNLQILCSDCNQGKGVWDETKWRKDTDDGK